MKSKRSHPKIVRMCRFFCITAFLAGASICTVAPLLAQGSSYRIGPKDLIELEIHEAPEMSGEHRVAEDGTISIALIGDVRIGGLTSRQIQSQLSALLEERYLRNATVSVDVLEYRSRPINVIGAVKEPGYLDLSGGWSLLEAITAAGGLAPQHGSSVYLRRESDNGLTAQVEISIDDLFLRGDPNVNVPLVAGDLINIPEAAQISISLLGEVESPGGFDFRSNDRVTLLAAIAKAGGLSDRASKKIVIKRRRDRGEEEITVDYGQIVSGKKPDVVLEGGDVVLVKKSFF